MKRFGGYRKIDCKKSIASHMHFEIQKSRKHWNKKP